MEDQAVVALLFVIGGLGVVAGLVCPKCTVELSLGSLMLFAVIRSMIEDAVGRSRSRRDEDA